MKKKITLVSLLIFITLASLGFKIAYINNTEIISPLRADAGQYVLYGFNLYKYRVFSQERSKTPTPDSFRSPGFPFLIALSFHLGGPDNFYLLTLLIQAIITSLLVPLSYLLARMLLPTIGAFFVSLLVAVSPHLMSISSYILSESLLSFLFLTAITSFLYGIRNSNGYMIIFSYIFFGLSYLTNEITFFIPFVVTGFSFLYILLTQQLRKNIKFVKIILLGLIIFSLFPIGWILRNSLHVPPNSFKSSTRALSTLTHGTYPDFIYKNPQLKYFPYREDPEQPEYSSSVGRFIEVFSRRVKERPLRYLSWYTIEKPYYLWTWGIMQGQGDIYIYPVKKSLFTKYSLAYDIKNFLKFLHILLHISIYFGLITLLLPGRHKADNLNIYILFAVFSYLTLIYAIFVPWPRYAIPYRPIFYTIGVWSIHSVFILAKEHLPAKFLSLKK